MSYRSYIDRRRYNFVTLMQRSCNFDDAIYLRQFILSKLLFFIYLSYESIRISI